MKITLSPRRRQELEARTLTGIGRGLLAIGVVACVMLCLINAAENRPVMATFFGAVTVLLCVADRVLFPPLKHFHDQIAREAVAERLRMDAAARFGSSRLP